jgi:hypothetical protein
MGSRASPACTAAPIPPERRARCSSSRRPSRPMTNRSPRAGRYPRARTTRRTRSTQLPGSSARTGRQAEPTWLARSMRTTIRRPMSPRCSHWPSRMRQAPPPRRPTHRSATSARLPQSGPWPRSARRMSGAARHRALASTAPGWCRPPTRWPASWCPASHKTNTTGRPCLRRGWSRLHRSRRAVRRDRGWLRRHGRCSLHGR